MQGYRKVLLTLPAKGVTTIDFNGTNPNYFRVANAGGAALYCGLQHMPTRKLYEFKVETKQTRMYCEDRGYPKLYIYNDSSSTADVIVYSFEAAFSPEVMAFSDFNIAENEEQTVNVEISGFTEMLPTGTNNIGKVDVNSLPTATETKLDTMITALQTLSGGDGGEGAWSLADIANLLSYTDGLETAIATIDGVLDNIYGKVNSMTGGVFSPCSSITAGGTFSGKMVKLLTNDGDTDIKLTYGTNNFVLKAGESITEFGLGETTINFTIAPNTVGETITFRCLYF